MAEACSCDESMALRELARELATQLDTALLLLQTEPGYTSSLKPQPGSLLYESPRILARAKALGVEVGR